MGGIAGQFYKQFALTIASATLISLAVSLSLSPTLAALLLKPHAAADRQGKLGAFGAAISRGFDRFAGRYGEFARRMIRVSAMVLIVYVGLLAIAAWRIVDTPRGFIPARTRARSHIIQLPVGASVARTDAIMGLDII
jgi:multidrug efflux pump subunit AcrB